MLVALAGCDSAGPGSPAPTGLRLAPVDSGFDFSLFLSAPPGDTDRVFVVERGGRILLRKHGVRQDSAFLNLTALTGGGHEYGVYSLAFHPDYAVNRRLFVYYVDNNADTRVVEYRADPDFDHADPTSAQPILQQAQAANAVLYGGLIRFGPDGYLYIGLGDGPSGGGPTSSAQDSTSLLGKMLRIDVDHGSPYTIPADNPFAARAGWRPEIWLLGLRNPWRWSFDAGTGDLYVADVGQDRREEVDLLPAATAAGSNLGWPIEEGSLCFQPLTGCSAAGLVPPVYEYDHGLGPACAITGGDVYRGARFPAWQGTYFFGDYCAGWVRSFRMVSGSPTVELPELAAPLINDNVVSFGEDARGEIYVVMASGRVYRLEAAGG
jgi:glucose/arabinose dehydrogenase